jgi:coniferyl-aldehyde dehydrogenase
MNNISKFSDADRLGNILAVQRTAFLRDGSPSLAQRRADLDKLKSALIVRRNAIEDAINADFGHRSRHETAIMEVMAVVEGIKYLDRNLRKFMRPTRRHVALHMLFGKARVEYQPLGVVCVMSVELSRQLGTDAACHGHRRRKPGYAQTVRVHTRHERAAHDDAG